MKRLRRLLAADGDLSHRPGLAAGVLALGLAVLCLLGVLAFHFPEYLTTPELRRRYDVDWLRGLMFGAIVLSGALSLYNAVRGRLGWLSLWTFALLGVVLALGGHAVPVGDFPDGTPYLGLDWLVLDLVGSALLFVFIEKLFALRREQPVFRADWQTDLQHFAVNHLLVGFMLLATNLLVHRLFGWAVAGPVQAGVLALPWIVQVLLLVLVADLAQYALHRAYHRVPWLWRLHSVHHSVEVMDWLAGSRMHLLEVLITRTLILGVIFVLGFSKSAMDAYIVIVGFHAVLNHANVRQPTGRWWALLSRVIVTPHFHHWHHSQAHEALDRNFAAHFAFVDHLFGTAAPVPAQAWPTRYGVLDETVPRGFWRQTLHPFTKRQERAAIIDS